MKEQQENTKMYKCEQLELALKEFAKLFSSFLKQIKHIENTFLVKDRETLNVRIISVVAMCKTALHPIMSAVRVFVCRVRTMCVVILFVLHSSTAHRPSF